MTIGSLIFLLGILPLAAQTKTGTPPEALYARSKPSVVTILTLDTNRAPVGQGSGFIIAKNRVVTNYHVVAGSAAASVVFSDGETAEATGIVAGGPEKDLVIVEVETGERPSLVLGDELQLKVGDTVYAIGAPNGLSASLSNGLVSAFRQDEGQFLVQTTAAIAPGSSGGPLFNNQGQVVGVTTSRLKDGGFGFAIGAGDVQRLLKAPLEVKRRFSELQAHEAKPWREIPGEPFSLSGTVTNTTNLSKPVSAAATIGFDSQGNCVLRVGSPLYGSGSCSVEAFSRDDRTLTINSSGPSAEIIFNGKASDAGFEGTYEVNYPNFPELPEHGNFSLTFDPTPVLLQLRDVLTRSDFTMNGKDVHMLLDRDLGAFFDKDSNYLGIRVVLDAQQNPILRIEDHKNGSTYVDPSTNKTVLEWHTDGKDGYFSRTVGELTTYYDRFMNPIRTPPMNPSSGDRDPKP